MHGRVKKMASERAWWSYFLPHFVKNIIRRFILKPEARREYYIVWNIFY